MSTSLGSVNNIHANQFWGGNDRGVCIQLTNMFKDGNVQLSAAEIIALMPAFKVVIDSELNRQKKECEKVIAEHKELEKSIVNDMRKVAEMAINQPVFDMASLLMLGGLKLEGAQE